MGKSCLTFSLKIYWASTLLFSCASFSLYVDTGLKIQVLFNEMVISRIYYSQLVILFFLLVFACGTIWVKMAAQTEPN